jgi:cytochrome P450
MMVQLVGSPNLEAPGFIAGMTRVTSYEECREILQSRAFGAFESQSTDRFHFLGDTLLDINGPAHVQRRKLEAGLFTRASLVRYERDHLLPMIDTALDLAALAGRKDDGFVHIDLIAVLRTILHRLSATVAGIDGVHTEREIDRFRWFVAELTKAAMVDFATEDHQAIIRHGLEVRAQFVEEFLKSSLERRRRLVEQFLAGSLDSSGLPHDLLTVLVLHEDPDWPEGMLIREVAGLYLNASTSTTLQEATHAVVHLMEWFDDHPDDRARATSLGFLRAAAHHALRMHTTAPALLREALDDVSLRSTGKWFEKGERVALITRLANRDPKVFPDPDRFDAYREIGEGVSPWGLTFGAGEHQCIGRPLVTGLTGPAETTSGTLTLILQALFAAGLEMEPGDPPRYVEDQHLDAFERFPVRFTGL